MFVFLFLGNFSETRVVIIRLSLLFASSIIIMFYYMARSVSRQDEPNRTLWLASRAGKIELSSARDYPPCPGEKFPRKPNNKSFIQ